MKKQFVNQKQNNRGFSVEKNHRNLDSAAFDDKKGKNFRKRNENSLQ